MINPKPSEPPPNLTHEAGTAPVDLHRNPDATNVEPLDTKHYAIVDAASTLCKSIS